MDKVKQHYQLVLILVLLVALSISVITRPDNSEVNQYVLETRIDSLHNVIKANNKLREEYDHSIALLSDSISGLNDQIAKNNDEISDLKHQYDETMDSIAKFSTSNITEFFTNRYK